MQHGACRPIVGRGFSSRWVGGALHQARLSSAFRQQRQFHVAIVGSGPAGFYTTKFLFRHAGEKVKVDMFERLPTPFGLVRFGVAPDHPEVKNVINDFTTIAASPQFRFFGNVEIGADVTLRNLEDAYDAVVLCMGAQGERILKIPGEGMRGVVGAPAFVKWYNGHPDYSALSDELPESVGAEAVVVGNGNVALDVARLLARSPAELRATDMLEGAIQRIATWQSNGLRTLHVLGRRGVVQAAFTNKELRELLHISDDVLPIIDPEEVELSMNAASKEELTKNRPKKRAMEIIDKMVDNFSQRETTSKRLVWLHFLAAPKEIIANGQPTPSCSGMLWSRMRLTGEPGRQTVEETGDDRKIDCGLVVRSVGFDLTPIDGVPINERKRIPHQHGRVQEGEDARRSLYVSGWLKRGPTGVIASNIPDAQETATAVYKDLVGSGAPSKANPGPVEATLAASGVQRVSFADWRKLQEIELQRGAEAGRAAVKLTDTAEMLKLLSG